MNEKQKFFRLLKILYMSLYADVFLFTFYLLLVIKSPGNKLFLIVLIFSVLSGILTLMFNKDPLLKKDETWEFLHSSSNR